MVLSGHIQVMIHHPPCMELGQLLDQREVLEKRKKQTVHRDPGSKIQKMSLNFTKIHQISLMFGMEIR